MLPRSSEKIIALGALLLMSPTMGLRNSLGRFGTGRPPRPRTIPSHAAWHGGSRVAPTGWYTSIDCFTLLLARHLPDASCYIGPSMPSGICMEIHTEIVQKRKKKQSRDEGIPRQPHVYLWIDEPHQRLDQPITNLDRNILRGHQRT